VSNADAIRRIRVRVETRAHAAVNIALPARQPDRLSQRAEKYVPDIQLPPYARSGSIEDETKPAVVIEFIGIVPQA